VPAFIRDWLRLKGLPYSSFDRGAAQQEPLQAAGQRIAAGICYEDAYGSTLLPPMRSATMLLNVTNDSWFGHSPARYQHLQISRLRATGNRPSDGAGRQRWGVRGDRPSRRDRGLRPEYEANVMRGTLQPRARTHTLCTHRKLASRLPGAGFWPRGGLVGPAQDSALTGRPVRLAMLNFTTTRRSTSASSSPFTQFRGLVDMSLFVVRRMAFIASVVVAVGACSPHSSAAPQGVVQAPPAAATPAVEAPTPAQPVGTLNGRVLPDFATLVEQVGPAVVSVSVLEQAHQVRNSGRGGEEGDDPFRNFSAASAFPRLTRGRARPPLPPSSAAPG
jgi:hypothetical protein